MLFDQLLKTKTLKAISSLLKLMKSDLKVAVVLIYYIHCCILLISFQRLRGQNNIFLSHLAIMNIFLIHCNDCIKHQHIKLDKTPDVKIFQNSALVSWILHILTKIQNENPPKIKKLESNYFIDPNFVFIGIMRKILIPN